MSTGLELFNKDGEVVDTLEADVEDTDELESVLNPEQEEQEPDSEEPAAEGETEEEAKPTDEGEPVVPPAEEGEVPPDTAEGTPEPTEDTPTDLPIEDVNAILRSKLSKQEKELAFLKLRLEKLEGAVSTEPDPDEEAPLPARIEELQATINQIGATKGAVFDVLLATMEVNPQYADIKQVCSQENLNYIIDEAADVLAAKEGRDSVEIALELEAAIWSEANPYKTMYEMIKEYHPKYKAGTKPTEEKPEETPPKVEETPTKDAPKPKPKPAPASIADAGKGTVVSLSGWTAARIDDMSEEELEDVPKAVYEKYLQGQLD